MPEESTIIAREGLPERTPRTEDSQGRFRRKKRIPRRLIRRMARLLKR